MEKSRHTSQEKQHRGIRAALPPDMQKINIVTNGIIMGKSIDIALKGNKATTIRIKKARNAWNILRKRLISRSKLSRKTKTLIRNALIRSTLTYALQTHEITEQDQKWINSFAC